jgi:glycosyltransferase involved in cell wall biosynthesis
MDRPPTAFSVIIPTYGSRPSLRDAVESVLSQSLPSFQVVVVCDGDGDDQKWVDDLLADVTDPRLSVVSESHKGVAAARNLGIARSTHPWVTFLDDDDRARPGWLACWAETIRPDTLAVTACVRYQRALGKGEIRSCVLDVSDLTMNASSVLAGGVRGPPGYPRRCRRIR